MTTDLTQARQLARGHDGVILSVDAENGQAVVRLLDGPFHGKLQVPIAVASQGAGSSWVRYMPDVDTHVVVGYKANNTPYIAGYARHGNAGGTAQQAVPPRQSGYADLRAAAAARQNGLTKLRALQPGEFDSMSAGGAGIYGSRGGVLLTEAGTVSVTLSKGQETAQTAARIQVDVISGGGTERRLGEIRRVLPTSLSFPTPSAPIVPNLGAYPPSPIALNTLREERVRVGVTVAASPIPGGFPAALLYYSRDAGTPTDDLGLPIPVLPPVLGAASALFQPASPATRLVEKTYTLASTPVLPVAGYSRFIDVLGNETIELNPLAVTGRHIVAMRQFLYGEVNATLAAGPAGKVWLGSEGALRSLTPGASLIPQPYLMSATWDVARKAFHTAVSTALGIMNTALAVPVPTPPGIAAAVGTFGASFLAAIAAFELQSPTFYSVRVFGE